MKTIVKNVRVDEIKVKFHQLVNFEQALCEVILPLLPDCIVEIDIVSTGKRTLA